MDFNSLLPLLKILTSPDGQKIFFFLVVSLTVVVAVIRIVLRKDLENLISQVKKLISERDLALKHPIIEEVEKRIITYEKRADTFNASVIIDQVYSRDKLGIASRDSWDFVCRSFPNVLISLGLLGTFVGITSNLGSIQGILRNSTGTTEQITARLQEPLNGMATAFGSSLISLVCGIALTLVNLIFNTTVAKYRFLSLLEDYLNSKAPSTPTGAFLTEIQGSLRSFRQEMVSIFKNEIAQAIGNSFTSQIAQITEENKRLTANLNSLVTGFRDSATQISSSSEAFKDAAEFLSRSDLPNSVNNFSSTIEKATSIFEETSISIADSSKQFQEATQKLDAHSENSIELYQTLSELIQITQSNQENLLDAMLLIQKEKEVLVNTVNLIKDIRLNLEESANDFDAKSKDSLLVKEELVKLTRNVKLLTEKTIEKLYQGLDFGGLHEDNQKIIDLLQEISVNPNIFDKNTQFNSSNKSQDNYLNESLMSISNDLQKVTLILSEKKDSDQETKYSNSSNLLQIDGLNKIETRISQLYGLINNINKQITTTSNYIQQNNKGSWFQNLIKSRNKK
ncbi:hypothetical protein H6F42_01925 [Pseudanabaena sp. FACHB-1998]|uniref:hypothetical protein n=1 Tax=Pseudanabaena sp. FACHB-1998 TaxID=2692858 RepID=UPI001681226A|nr:hypothetical protein [Pseudanabaena sp. FACHB-1998]MBD2175677.1 hypothetical protein [Pseudanabaena sp. FACHB-1998]